jgi:hypothetical protein
LLSGGDTNRGSSVHRSHRKANLQRIAPIATLVGKSQGGHAMTMGAQVAGQIAAQITSWALATVSAAM